MRDQESKRHHFVPKLLLKPWLIEEVNGQLGLKGYWWDPKRGSLTCKQRGLDSFCNQLDLLSLTSHPLGRDAIERVFFGEIDSKGASARDMLLVSGPTALTNDQRCDFARLLLSLDARRPVYVEHLRKKGPAFFADELDSDPEIGSALSHAGVEDKPSEFAQTEFGWSFEDRAVAMTQGLVDNIEVGGRLINAHWAIIRVENFVDSLILSDRPLIRFYGYNHPAATWILPLNPSAVFVACNSIQNLSKLMGLPSQRFAKLVNRASVNQAERFVFCLDRNHELWLGRHLKRISVLASGEPAN